MNKTTNNASVKTCSKSGKGDSKEDFIKDKVSKNADIYGLANGLTNVSSHHVNNLVTNKSVENGKHLFNDSNKYTGDPIIVGKHIHRDGTLTEAEIGNKSKSIATPNSSNSISHKTGTVSRVKPYEKLKKGKLQKWDSKENLSKLALDAEAHLIVKNTADCEPATSPEKPKEDTFSDCVEDSFCIEESACCSRSEPSILINETVSDKVIESLGSLSIEASPKEPCNEEESVDLPPIEYVQYENETQMPMIMKIIQKDLSEPYSIYTYRYFIHNWPKLCFLAMCEGNCVGAIVCKLDLYRKAIRRGYIAMLAVDKSYRKRGIGSTLVKKAIQEMIQGEADEVVLETEITNKPALKLYEALGFVRDKRLFRYYLNGVDALRLKLWLR